MCASAHSCVIASVCVCVHMCERVKKNGNLVCWLCLQTF